MATPDLQQAEVKSSETAKLWYVHQDSQLMPVSLRQTLPLTAHITAEAAQRALQSSHAVDSS